MEQSGKSEKLWKRSVMCCSREVLSKFMLVKYNIDSKTMNRNPVVDFNLFYSRCNSKNLTSCFTAE